MMLENDSTVVCSTVCEVISNTGYSFSGSNFPVPMKFFPKVIISHLWIATCIVSYSFVKQSIGFISDFFCSRFSCTCITFLCSWDFPW